MIILQLANKFLLRLLNCSVLYCATNWQTVGKNGLVTRENGYEIPWYDYVQLRNHEEFGLLYLYMAFLIESSKYLVSYTDSLLNNDVIIIIATILQHISVKYRGTPRF